MICTVNKNVKSDQIFVKINSKFLKKNGHSFYFSKSDTYTYKNVFVDK